MLWLDRHVEDHRGDESRSVVRTLFTIDRVDGIKIQFPFPKPFRRRAAKQRTHVRFANGLRQLESMAETRASLQSFFVAFSCLTVMPFSLTISARIFSITAFDFFLNAS